MADKAGGILARIGTPAGVSIAADIAGIGGSTPPIISLTGTCDADMGASTTIIDCLELAGYGNDFFNGKYWMQVLLNANSVGAAPEINYRQITDYVSATGVFTCTAFSANVEANDEIAVLHESLSFQKYQEYTTGSGTWTCPVGVKQVDVLLVSGGGGSGGAKRTSINTASGGGGGGAIRYNTGISVVPAKTYAYSVGAGGVAGTGVPGAGSTGGTTTFGNISITGGLGSVGKTDADGAGGMGAAAEAFWGGTMVTLTGGTAGAAGVAGTVGGNGNSSSYGTSGVGLHAGAGGGGGGAGGGAGGITIYQTTGAAAGVGTNPPGGGGSSWGIGGSGASTDDTVGNAAAANTGGGGGGSMRITNGQLTGAAGGSGYIRIIWR
jgi:hypothetical protein